MAPRMVVADRLLTEVVEEDGLRMSDGDRGQVADGMSLARTIHCL